MSVRNIAHAKTGVNRGVTVMARLLKNQQIQDPPVIHLCQNAQMNIPYSV